MSTRSLASDAAEVRMVFAWILVFFVDANMFSRTSHMLSSFVPPKMKVGYLCRGKPSRNIRLWALRGDTGDISSSAHAVGGSNRQRRPAFSKLLTCSGAMAGSEQTLACRFPPVRLLEGVSRYITGGDFIIARSCFHARAHVEVGARRGLVIHVCDRQILDGHFIPLRKFISTALSCPWAQKDPAKTAGVLFTQSLGPVRREGMMPRRIT